MIRRMFIWLVAIVVAPLPVTLGQNPSRTANPQTLFQLEERFTDPSPLPASVLETLQADTSNQQLFENCPTRGSQHTIPSSWFLAAEVDLKRGDLSGLVVRADNCCLWGANIGPFWVFRRTNIGYELVLDASALGLELLDTRTNGYRDIRLSSAFGGEVHSTVFKFIEGRYRAGVKHGTSSD
jgi:hypothetical protein